MEQESFPASNRIQGKHLDLRLVDDLPFLELILEPRDINQLFVSEESLIKCESSTDQ